LAAVLGTVALVTLGGLTAVAQEGAEDARSDQGKGQLREEVTVRLIELSAVFLDEEGRPVRDLAPEEVTVRAGGRDHEAAFLELAVQEAPDPESLPDAEVLLGVPGASASVGKATEGPRRYYIVLIDVENDAPQTRGSAATQLRNFVFEALGPQDLVSVMSFDGEMNVDLPFSSSREEVGRAIRRAYQREQRAAISTRLRIDQLVDRLGDCSLGTGEKGRRVMNEYCVRNLLSTYMEEVRPDIVEYYEALETLMRFAGALQGQVTVLAVTHGKSSRPSDAFIEAVEAVFGFTRETTTLKPVAMARESMLRARRKRLLRTAMEQDVVLYVLDRTTLPGGLASAEHGGGFEPGAQPFRSAYLSESNDMAVDTGGAMVRDFDLRRAAKKAYEREQGRYTLGFYPDELLSRDDLDDVEVLVSREDVTVESGQAFYAGARSPWELSGSIALGELQVTGNDDDALLVPLTIETDPRQLGYKRADSTTVDGAEVMSAELTAHITLHTSAGTRVAEAFHTFAHEYDVPIWEAGREKPLTIPGQVVAEPGTYRLTVKLRNFHAGVGGQLTRELELELPAS
jgi:VWFA-related protein